MLEQLFGSKTRTQLLRTFLQNPDETFFVRELTRKLDVQINSVRHELKNLEKFGLLEVVKKEQKGAIRKKHFRIDRSSVLYPELKALFLKSRVLVEKDFVTKLQKTGKVSFFLLTGKFTGRTDAPTDVFVVGRVNRKKFSDLIRKFEISFGHEINFTIMDKAEMKYRMDVMDRFLYDVLEEPKIVFIDEMFSRQKTTA